MSIEGIDYAWGFPGVDVIKNAGYQFVMRYLSHDTGKNLDPAETNALTKAGIWIGVVWETTANRALAGYSAGQQDAKDALAQANACHMPSDRPIYFAVDFDARNDATMREIGNYFDGVIAVLGKERVGMYGGYLPIKWAFDAHKIAWGWQTYAWSGGNWDPRAQLRQYSNGHKLNGVGVDYNHAMRDDYGQWRMGESAMAISDADVQKLVKAIWTTDGAVPPAGYTSAGNPTWEYVNVLRTAASEGHNVNGAVAALMQKVDALTVKVDAILAGEKAETPVA